MQCNVCATPLDQFLYVGDTACALTSLATLHPGKTQVYFCQRCSHVQSVEIENIDAFYDHEYDILVDSEEEDQLYEVVKGKNVYRTEHQVQTLQRKLTLPHGAKVLDYGCAKSSTLRALLELGVTSGVTTGVTIKPYVFDVSDRYLPFWEKFLSQEQCAIHDFPKHWNQQFDLVTSFFSLEHMSQPQQALQNIHRALRPQGKIYGIVPNLFSNTADLIVVDHVNHFTRSSLQTLLHNQGFAVLEIDETAHRGAFVFLAQKNHVPQNQTACPTVEVVQDTYLKADALAAFWTNAAARVQAFEATLAIQQPVAIYGAGFYGAFLAANLQQPERLACVVDQNPFLQGRKIHGVQVVAPEGLLPGVDHLLVGLNPLYAKQCMAQIEIFSRRRLNYFFL